MVDHQSKHYDNDKWIMSNGPLQSRLVISLELNRNGEWIEKEHTIKEEAGTYRLIKE